MPVYNTQMYVQEALGSILKQTLENIEVIVVDDASTDRSPEIIARMAADDCRIKVFTQEVNRGQSVARNRGIEEAVGEYIYFMDSDDWLEPDALELCYQKCERQQLDFVFFEADVLNEDTRTNFSSDYHYHDLMEDVVYDGKDLLSFQLDSRQFKVTPWLDFVRRSMLDRWNPVFYPGIIHEDQLYAMMLYIHASRVGYIRRSFFKRRIRAASTMTKRMSRRNRLGYQTVFEQLELFARTQDYAVQTLVIKHRSITLDAFLYTAWELPVKEKMIFLRFCMRHGYWRWIKWRSLAIFLLKH